MNPLKSGLAKTISYLFIIMSVLGFMIESAHAHGVYVFAWVAGDTVYVESKFSGGKKVNSGKIIVTDSRGTELLTGTTNDQGEFSFKIPEKTELKIVLLAGAGHRAEWVIPLSEMDMPDKKETPRQEPTAEGESAAPSQSKVETDAAEKPKPLPALTEKELQAAVEQAVAKELQPVMKMLAESKQQGPTARDIFSGFGYIIGLVGIAAYIYSRKRKNRTAKA
jgi:nickel transport protein